MKKSEIKKIAEQISRAERTIQESSDASEVANAKSLIMQLSERVESLEDLLLLDDLIQEKLKKS